VREGVLEAFPDERIELYIIWTQVLDTDGFEGAERASAVFDDSRAYQFHDPHRAIGEAFADTISMPSIVEVCKATNEELSTYEGILDPDVITGPAAVFDTVFFFEPGARWPVGSASEMAPENEAPTPASWVTQLDPAIYVGVDPERFRFGEALKNEVTTLAGALFASRRADGRPNVLLIVADDMRTELGCYGDVQSVSPAIDRLAEQGMVFTRAYAQTAESNHSRVSLLSGIRPPNTGSFENSFWPDLDLVTLPELFNAGGYETFKAGQLMHSVRRARLRRQAKGSENHDRRIWKKTIQTLLAKPSKTLDDPKTVARGAQKQRSSAGINYGPRGADFLDVHDGRMVEAAARFLRERSSRAGPFLLAVGFTKPRPPFFVPEPFYERVKGRDIPDLDVPSDDLLDVPERALVDVKTLEFLAPEQRREAFRGYLASIAFVDEGVGRLLSALKDGGHAENTVIVFVSDHGQMLGEHNLWRESVLFEEALRIPLIVALPEGIAEKVVEGGGASGRCERLVELVDLYPTLAELCGLPIAGNLEGSSLVPLLRDPERDWKESVFAYLRHGETIRTEKWRLTRWENGTIELYDHDGDPGEVVNRNQDSELGLVMSGLMRRLTQGWRACLPK